MLCLIAVFGANSQTFNPIVEVIDGKQYGCFTLDEGKLLLISIEKSKYCDSINYTLNDQILGLERIIETQDSIINYDLRVMDNYETIIDDQEKIIENNTKEALILKDKAKRDRRNRNLLGITTILALVLLAI